MGTRVARFYVLFFLIYTRSERGLHMPQYQRHKSPREFAFGSERVERVRRGGCRGCGNTTRAVHVCLGEEVLFEVCTSPWRPTRVTLCGSSSIACHGGPRRYVVSQAHNVHKQFQRHMLLVEARARLASRLFPVVVSRLVTDENVWCARDCS